MDSQTGTIECSLFPYFMYKNKYICNNIKYIKILNNKFIYIYIYIYIYIRNIFKNNNTFENK